jgi:quercetin dioxygenase-like cupin family protein
MLRLLSAASALLLTAQAEMRVIRFSEAQQFRMGNMVSNRIVHPAMGAKLLTFNLSESNPGDEFAQHLHDESDDTILVLRGAGDLRQGSSRRRVPAGQAVFVPPRQIHGTVTTEPNTVMVSFQTPPDLALYSGARDPSRGATDLSKGAITPGAVKYIDFASRNGVFLDPGLGAPRVKAWHLQVAPGGDLSVEVPKGSEKVVFVWMGSVTANETPVNARDTLFLRQEPAVRIRNTGAESASLILVESPPGPGNGFAGRWTIESNDPAPKVFWMEIADTIPPVGSFFGVTGGRLAEMREPRIQGEELSFRVERVFEGVPPRRVEAITKVRRIGERIEGTTTVAGKTYAWKGGRTIDLPDRDDGTWREAESVELFRGALPKDWEFRDGALRNKTPKAADLVSRERFSNFQLRLEYRLPAGGNSGIGLRDHYELQLADDYGQPPSIHGNASLYSQIAPRVNASRRPGEWQQLDLRLVGRDLTVILNGTVVIDHQPIRGLTGMARNAREGEAGPISLQGDHGPVEFRNVVATPLESSTHR